MRLITFPMSHHCEKARRALERLGLPYVEERHLQGFHYLRMYRVSGGPYVPVLVDGDEVIPDSTLILEYLDRYASPDTRLFPEEAVKRDRVEDLEALFDGQLGVDSRRWIYFPYLRHPVEARRIASQGVSGLEKALFRVSSPLFSAFLKVRLRVTEREAEEGLDRARKIVRLADDLLHQGSKYLLGDRFTAAGLTLACMLAPFVLPRQCGILLPTIDEVPGAMRPTVEEFRRTPAGSFVLRLFESERVKVVN